VKFVTNPRLGVTPDQMKIGEPDFLLRDTQNQKNNKPAWLGVDAKLHMAVRPSARTTMKYVTLKDLVNGKIVTGEL